MQRGMGRLAVLNRLTFEMPLHRRADEPSYRQGEHRRGRDERDCHDGTPELAFARLPQWSSPSTFNSVTSETRLSFALVCAAVERIQPRAALSRRM
jgi:hypothetical protein